MTTNETRETNGPGGAATGTEGGAGAGARTRWATLAVCCVAGMLLGIDNSVLNYAIPSLVRALDPSATQLLWIADSYGFAMAGLMVLMGNLGDRFGRKRMLLLGATAFGAASLATAYAPGAATLIAARVLLGAAGAMILPSTLSLVRNAFTDPRERTMAIGISGGTGAASFALGPVVGGLLLDHFWWGSVFLINVPVMALVVLVGAVVLPESRNSRPGRLDRLSVPLSVVGLLGLIYAIKTLGVNGAHVTSAWIAGAVGLAALTVFVRRQTRLTEPLLDLRLFRNPAFGGAVGSTTVTMFASSTLSLAFSLYFQTVRGWSPLVASLALLPGPLSAVAAAPLAAVLVPRIGRARVVAIGLFLMAVSTAGLGTMTPHSDYWDFLPVVVVNGCGIILTIAVTSDTVMAAAPRDRTGAAAAVSETAQELGGALGIAVLGSVLSAVYRDGLALPARLPASAAHLARESVSGGVQAGAALPGQAGRAFVAGAKLAFTHAVHVTTLAGAAVLLLGAVAALFTLRGVPAVIEDPEDRGPGTRDQPGRAPARAVS
ncbi:MFS transporter [Streptomyces sp. ICBB 8177]|uniref:MFS transporter n=1 Tax=Streptomyces sp. ICBB 8177 TaxID=563922 RepID=UPI000D67A5A5|nr:MFS transporter [Streptomyces sp. ICBB 8177]PWI41278.1 MFS transporter [Streptomyces sp. ICBB 8177]